MPGSRLPLEVLEERGKKHLSGDERKKRYDEEIRNPKPVKRLTPPKWLSKQLHDEFRAISAELISLMPSFVSRLDATTIAWYCVYHSEWLAATQNLNSAINKSDEDKVQKWSLVQSRLFAQARSCAQDLGMNISSRCKLIIPQKTEQNNPDDEFTRRLKERQRAASGA